MKTVSACGTI